MQTRENTDFHAFYRLRSLRRKIPIFRCYRTKFTFGADPDHATNPCLLPLSGMKKRPRKLIQGLLVNVIQICPLHIQGLCIVTAIVAVQARWFLLGQSPWFWGVWKIVIFPPFRKLWEIAISTSFPTSRNFGK